MDYAVETLQIEIARLEKAMREYYSISLTMDDIADGKRADIDGMTSNKKELIRAIKVLNDWAEENKDKSPLTW